MNYIIREMRGFFYVALNPDDFRTRENQFEWIAVFATRKEADKFCCN